MENHPSQSRKWNTNKMKCCEYDPQEPTLVEPLKVKRFCNVVARTSTSTALPTKTFSNRKNRISSRNYSYGDKRDRSVHKS